MSAGTARDARRASRSGLAGRLTGAPAIVALGMAALTIVAGLTAVQVYIGPLDDDVYRASAVHYAHGLPGALVWDPFARGVARLYPLLLSPVFMVLEVETGVRVARVLGILAFASAAIPVALLGRLIGLTPRASAVAGVLTVAVPWIAIGTVLYSETLSYPLFAWTVFAMVWALRRPAWWRELVVLGAIGALFTTRAQFGVVAPAWVVVLVVVTVVEARRAGAHWRDAGRVIADAARRFPVISLLAAAGVLGAVVLEVTGLRHGGFRSLMGPYAEIQDRTGLPPSLGVAALFEVAMLSVGVGVIPALLAVAWARDAFAGRAGPDAFRVVAVGGTVLGVVFTTTLIAQGGWLGPHSEERYYIYAVPFLWLGAVAAVYRPAVRAARIVAAGALVAVTASLLPLIVNTDAERMVLGPLGAITTFWLPRLANDLAAVFGMDRVLDGPDVLALIVIALTAFAAAMWRRGHRRAALAPAVALQVGLLLLTLAMIRGEVEGYPGRTDGPAFADMAWVDRATPGDPKVAWLLTGRVEPDLATHQRLTFYWNGEVDRLVEFGDLQLPRPAFPWDAAIKTYASATPDLGVEARGLAERLVVLPDSPFAQIAGRVEATQPGGLQLLVRERPARLTWWTTGLHADGQVVQEARIATRGGQRVSLRFAPPAEGSPAAVRVHIAGRAYRADGASPTVDVDLCGRSGIVRGRIVPEGLTALADGRSSAGVLSAVRVTPC